MKKRLTVFLGLAGVFFLFPEVAYADNCSFFADCFNTARAAAAAATAAGILAALASAAADFTPGLGEGKAAVQLFTGYDPITKERVPRWESAVGLIPVFGRVASRGIRMSTRAARTLRGAKALQTTARVVRKGTEVYETVRKPYDIGKAVKDTSKKISGHMQDYLDSQQKSTQSRYTAGSTEREVSTQQASSSGPRAYEAHAVFIPPDQLYKMLSGGFQSVAPDAPAVIAHDTLKDLAKTFGKNSDTLKSIAKAKDTIGNLPEDATMKDVVEKLKG